MRTSPAILIALLAFSVSACQTASPDTQSGSGIGGKTVIGTLGGAALGGYLGSRIGKGNGRLAATAGGVLVGAMVGGAIGRSMERSDRPGAAQPPASTGLYGGPLGQPVYLTNANGSVVTITPLREGRATTGEYCRDFEETVVVNRQPRSGYGVVCLMQGGYWQVIGQ